MEKKIQIENTTINIIYETDINQLKNNLKNVYNVINNISKKCQKNEIETCNWFYKEKDVKKLKMNSKNIFL